MDIGTQSIYPFSAWEKRAFHIMAKPIGAHCNMRCDYCYYLEKSSSASFSTTHSGGARVQRMSEETLQVYIRQYINAQPLGMPVVFTWHGGEALLLPISFYERAVALQRQYADGRVIENCIQTNGLLINESWCQFFRENNFLVGISLDGTEEQHDSYRRTVRGGATFARVMRGIELMNRYGVEYNILSTINRCNADDPIGYYRFLRSVGTQFIQFTPIVERISDKTVRYEHVEAPKISRSIQDRELHHTDTTRLAPYSVLPEQWGDFLVGVFDEWVRTDVGNIFVQLFDSTLANWLGRTPGVCTLGKYCGHAGVLEFDGTVYSCDHYVYPSYRLGNLHNQDLADMMNTPAQIDFGLAKYDGLTEHCLSCLYLTVCYGECPKNRFAISQEGEPGHNYLCKGYYKFWSHIAPYMDYMKSCLLSGEPASKVMNVFDTLR